MAGIPSWRDQMGSGYADARKWGTGINPIHAQRSGNESRNIAPTPTVPAPTGMESVSYLDMSYVAEDGGMDGTFLGAHPNLGEHRHRARTAHPSWGDGPSATPQGTRKRILREGVNPREGKTEQPRGEAGGGWLNKITSWVQNSQSADPSQLQIRTSERQRDEVRNNSAAVMRGTDAVREPIPSRITGQRLKVYSNAERHADMELRTIDHRTRPFVFRTAGTGPRHYLLPNENTSVTPLTREVPADVDTGMDESTILGDSAYTEGW